MVYYFYVDCDLDVDNILKPILDSMNRIVYLDDEQIIDIIAIKRDMQKTYSVQNLSPILAGKLDRNPTADFVFVSITSAMERDIP